jgi:hypothetical protein
MKNGFRILVGTAKEVEDELNRLYPEWFVFFHGFTATNELTTALIEITLKIKTVWN